MKVIFEGLDNAGKTTLIDMLKDHYELAGITTIVSKELTTSIGADIKELLAAGKLDPILKTYLFAADRQLRLNDLKEHPDKTLILFDRFLPSAIAYRMADGLSKEWVNNVNLFCPNHDLGFYIDITPDESIRRNSNKKFNIKYCDEKLTSIRNAYFSILKEYNLIYINGMQSLDDIFSEVVTNIDIYMNEKEQCNVISRVTK